MNGDKRTERKSILLKDFRFGLNVLSTSANVRFFMWVLLPLVVKYEEFIAEEAKSIVDMVKIMFIRAIIPMNFNTPMVLTADESKT